MKPLNLSSMVTNETKLETARTLKRREITLACNKAVESGFDFNGHHFDSDNQSRLNIIGASGAVTAGIPISPDFTWRTTANINIPMTGPEIIAMGAAMMQFISDTYQRSWNLKARIEAATTIEAIEAIVW